MILEPVSLTWKRDHWTHQKPRNLGKFISYVKMSPGKKRWRIKLFIFLVCDWPSPHLRVLLRVLQEHMAMLSSGHVGPTAHCVGPKGLGSRNSGPCWALLKIQLHIFQGRTEGDGTVGTQEEHAFAIASQIKHHSLSGVDPGILSSKSHARACFPPTAQLLFSLFSSFRFLLRLSLFLSSPMLLSPTLAHSHSSDKYHSRYYTKC